MIGGRGTLQHLSLNDGGQAIIRHYRRGGFVRHFIQDVYWERPFRPFTELTCTEMARQRGVPTIEVFAAGVQHLRFGCYRGVLISRKATGFSNLWEWLQARPASALRRSTLETVAQTIARLQTAGIFHADLNLTNMLVRITEATTEILVIDFDKGQIFPTPLPTHYYRHMLRRFQRSLRKLDPQHQFVPSAEEAIFGQVETRRTL